MQTENDLIHPKAYRHATDYQKDIREIVNKKNTMNHPSHSHNLVYIIERHRNMITTKIKKKINNSLNSVSQQLFLFIMIHLFSVKYCDVVVWSIDRMIGLTVDRFVGSWCLVGLLLKYGALNCVLQSASSKQKVVVMYSDKCTRFIANF